MKSVVALALLVTPLCAPLGARDVTVGSIRISTPWTRETAPGQVVGGGFLVITNAEQMPETLIGGATPQARGLELHSMIMDGGVMKMRPVKGGIVIPAGRSVALKPGGVHIMFMGVRAPFKRGQMVPVTLKFQRTGSVNVLFKVEPVGTMAPTDGGHHAGH